MGTALAVVVLVLVLGLGIPAADLARRGRLQMVIGAWTTPTPAGREPHLVVGQTIVAAHCFLVAAIVAVAYGWSDVDHGYAVVLLAFIAVLSWLGMAHVWLTRSADTD